DASKEELYGSGCVPRPQVHMFAEDLPVQYIGFVICRRFFRGQDATVAIGDFGILPSVMRENRLMVLWGRVDPALALDQPAPSPMGLMLVDARFGGHTLHHYPFDPVPTGQVVNGVPTIELQWKPPQRFENAGLPNPVNRLLQTWREPRDQNMKKTARALER